MRKKSPGKKKFKNTTFGARALKTARRGGQTLKNPSGPPSSVRTATYDIPGKRGRTDVMIAPTIRADPSTGQLKRMTESNAAKIALDMADFVRVKAKRRETVEQTRARADRKSIKFSKKLGKIADKRKKRRKQR